MKIKKSYLFYLFVIGLVSSVYYFDYYQGEQKQTKKEKDSILIAILKEDVTKVELKNSSGELELNKTDMGWDIKKPFQDDASEDATGWIQSLTTEKSMETIGEGETFEWTTYGLDKPKATIFVHSKAGTKIKLAISEKKNFEGNPFIKRDDEKLVYVGNSIWTTLLDKTAKELREKRLFRESSLVGLEKVSVMQGKTEFDFEMKDSKWISTAQSSWRLDQTKVREIVNVAQEIRATDYVSEENPSKENIERWGLNKPRLILKYQFKENKSWSAVFGQDKEKNWYVWPHELKRVAKVESVQVEKLLNISLPGLRDREFPFAFNKEEVKKLNLLAEKNLELSKQGDQWKGAVSGTIDQGEVNQFIEKVQNLRVAEFFDGKSTTPGLSAAKKQFIFADSTGKSLLDIKIGESFKKKEAETEKTYFYAKSSLHADVVALKEEDVKTLSIEKLTKMESKGVETKTDSPMPEMKPTNK